MDLEIMLDGSEKVRYRDPAIPIYVSRGDLKGMTNMAALCHWHEDIELLLPLQGHLTYNVNGTQVTVQEGNAIFVNSRQMHYGFSADGTDCIYICVTFRPQLLCANETIRDRYILPVLTSTRFSHMVLRRGIPEHRPLLAAICRIDGLEREENPGKEMLQLANLLELWQGIYRLAEDRINEAASADGNVRIQRQMLEYIRTHYQERISVDAIAAAGGVCRTKCCQIFKKYLGRTPNDYLNSFRLEKGMELLKSTGMSVTEVANSCGFSNPSYFTEMFTKHKGCSPKEYRKTSGAEKKHREVPEPPECCL